MNHIPIKLGPLALLLTVISICLTVLAILSVSTARADLALAERYADTVESRYMLEAEGQKFLASEEAVPGTEQVFERDNMRLTVALDEKGQVIRWTLAKEWSEIEGIGNLWLGE